MSLKNYDPALFELFERAFSTKGEVVIPFETLSAANAFALRMQRLRREMREEKHHLSIAADTLEVSVNRKTFEVSIRPQGYSYIGKVQAALARLPEISKEVEQHELENTAMDGYASRVAQSEDSESQALPTPRRRKGDAADKAPPSQKALEAFIKGEKK